MILKDGVYMSNRILAIDDDVNFLGFLKENLDNIGYNTITISDSNNAVKQLQENSFDCILLDVRLPGINGLELLDISLKKNPSTPVIMVSGQSSIKIAVEAIKLGAFDFVEKPIEPDKLHVTIKNAIEKRSLTKEKDLLRSELYKNYRLIGESQAIKEIINQINSIADTPAKVLIMGETGTGKELVAWAIHHNSNRKAQPYIKINCAAIPSELLESELFGYHKGAFTGANENKKGKFLAANGGTLFLDEIGDMNLKLQAKILRVLEENEVDVLGENSPKKIDVRIIAATNQNLEKKIKNGSFRKDLYYRLNVASILIPPLRKRKEDVIPLAYHFLYKLNETYNKQIVNILPDAKKILTDYNWPGNVRELRNIIEKSVLFSDSNNIETKDVLNALNSSGIIIPNNVRDKKLKDAKKEFEKNYIIAKLEKNNWNIPHTAKELGLDRSNLFKKMHNLGIEQQK